MTNLAPSGLMFSYSREGASATTFDSLGERLLGVAVAEIPGVLDAEVLDEAAAAPSTLVPAQAASGDAVSTTAIAARSRRLGSVTPVILSARYPPKHSWPGSEQTLTRLPGVAEVTTGPTGSGVRASLRGLETGP